MFGNLELRRTQSARSTDLQSSSDYPPRTSSRNSRDLTSYLRSSPEREREPSLPPQVRSKSLTATLLSSSPDEFKAATQHPFLTAAGQGSLSKHDLSRWLSQDRLYAETYVSFITSLIARVTLPYTFVSNKSKSLRWRIIKLLTSCLENIHREIDFFTTTAEKYGLKLDLPFAESSRSFGPNPVTEQYITLFRSFHLDPNQSLLEGLLVLWATEKCYLDAWSYASQSLDSSRSGTDDGDGGALRNEFIPNWSSDEFRKFVQEIAEVTDEWAAREGALRKIEVFRALWLHVLDIEKGFWPDVS